MDQHGSQEQQKIIALNRISVILEKIAAELATIRVAQQQMAQAANSKT